jgi:hypothetical protein
MSSLQNPYHLIYGDLSYYDMLRRSLQIKEWWAEGPSWRIGYIPTNKGNVDGINNINVNATVKSNSGVTTSVGLDLGQMDEQELRGIYPRLPNGMEHPMFLEYAPYLGVKGQDALNLLVSKPLNPPRHHDNLNVMAGPHYKINKIIAYYNQASQNAGANLKFQNLDPEIQKAYLNVAYQSGAQLDRPKKAPDFFNYAINGDWANMQAELLSNRWHPDVVARRNMVGNLLKKSGAVVKQAVLQGSAIENALMPDSSSKFNQNINTFTPDPTKGPVN